MIQHDLHMETAVRVKRRKVQVGVDDLDFRIGKDIARLDFAGTDRVDDDLLRFLGVQLADELLEVQDDLGNVFLDAFDRRELMQNSVNANGRCSNTGKTA